MNDESSAPKTRIAKWFAAQDHDASVPAFRRVFCGIWLAYDTVDVVWGMTEFQTNWFPHPRTPALLGLQVLLVISGFMMLRGRNIWAFGMMAFAARAFEGLWFFRLNDLFFVSVIDLFLAHSDGGPFARNKRPRWVREALLAQLAWIYFATAILKMNPDWLNGGHLFVRTRYLIASHGWPYPAWLARAFSSLAFDGALSKLAILGELSLGAVLAFRRPYWLGAALALGIHGFGTLVTNVWFFSASMIAAVLLLLPRSARPPDRAARDRQEDSSR